jgi:toxin ParE1/3/4
MANCRFTNKAVDDLTNIWNYTNKTWSQHQADTYYQLLIANCKDVANNPEVGRNYDGIAKNLRGFKAGKHIIFYRKIEENYVEITRILHEQMDLRSRMSED